MSKWVNKEELSDDDSLKLVQEVTDRLFTTERKKIGLAHIAEYEEEAKELVKNWGSYQGILTGIGGIDRLTKGMVGGELIILAGPTSHGKTLVGINIAVRVAESGSNVLFITLEMTHAQLAARALKTAEKPLNEINIFLQDEDEMNWKDVDRLIAEAKKDGIQLVVVDHLHYFTRELENVSEDLGRITKEFKKNAIRHNLPIVLISHIRKKMGNKSHVADNDELRGSSYIAQDADIVLFVKRNSDTETEITITKNRNRGFNPDLDTSILEIEEGAKIKSPQANTAKEIPEDDDIIADVQSIFPAKN